MIKLFGVGDMVYVIYCNLYVVNVVYIKEVEIVYYLYYEGELFLFLYEIYYLLVEDDVVFLIYEEVEVFYSEFFDEDWYY